MKERLSWFVLLARICNGKQLLGAQISLCNIPTTYYGLTVFPQSCWEDSLVIWNPRVPQRNFVSFQFWLTPEDGRVLKQLYRLVLQDGLYPKHRTYLIKHFSSAKVRTGLSQLLDQHVLHIPFHHYPYHYGKNTLAEAPWQIIFILGICRQEVLICPRIT